MTAVLRFDIGFFDIDVFDALPTPAPPHAPILLRFSARPTTYALMSAAPTVSVRLRAQATPAALGEQAVDVRTSARPTVSVAVTSEAPL